MEMNFSPIIRLFCGFPTSFQSWAPASFLGSMTRRPKKLTRDAEFGIHIAESKTQRLRVVNNLRPYLGNIFLFNFYKILL